MADWSSLPSDLVARIADCLLATNDVDCSMDLRAVCTNWRSSTDDPKNSSELRFRPRRWIIIDEIFQSDSRLLVNTLSGRVVRKDLPLLRRFFVVASTHGGFFVLAEKKPPHAACVLNPFTGHLIQFMAPLPSQMLLSAAVIGSSPSIVLLPDYHHRTYMKFVTDPSSERFMFTCDEGIGVHHGTYHMNRLAFLGGVYGSCDAERGPVAAIPVGLTAKISDFLRTLIHPALVSWTSLADYCFIVEFAGQVFIILKLLNQMSVLKLDIDSEVLEPVHSIGNLAIFVGNGRCFAVNAEKFTSVDANCIYFVRPKDWHGGICKYDIKEEKLVDRVSEAIDPLEVPASSIPRIHHLWDSVSKATPLSTTTPPFTLIQLLSSYTTNVRPSELKVVEDTCTSILV